MDSPLPVGEGRIAVDGIRVVHVVVGAYLAYRA